VRWVAVLRLEGIEVFYGKVQALFGVSLEVNEGEIVSIIGANGAGKSTTLKTVVGLLTPARGQVVFSGRRIDGWEPDRITTSGICLVPEGRQVFPYFTVRENLLAGACGRRRTGAPEREIQRDIHAMFELFPRLRERANQKAWSLSGGEQQMLAIARGLVGRPRLLLLDEPSLGLAPVLVRDVFETIKAINQRGTTILLVEQNAHMALACAHRAYVLEGGRVVLSGTGEELRSSEKVKAAYLGG